MTKAMSILIPFVGVFWVLFASIAIVQGRRRRADPSYRPATKLLIGFIVILLFAAIGTVCLLLVSEEVPVERIVRVILLVDTGLDTMMLRFGLLGVYGISIFGVFSLVRRRRS
jgi:hypothetical protein